MTTHAFSLLLCLHPPRTVSMSSNSIGPRLPPHLQRELENSSSDDDDKTTESRKSIGPTLPAHLCKTDETEKKRVAGPQLPPHLLPSSDRSDEEEKCSSSSYGPSLPPGYTNQNEESRSIGPTLPSHLKVHTDGNEEDDSDDEFVGPMLPSDMKHDSSNDVTADFEARAKAMKNKLTGKDEDDTTLKRETWMTELPPEFSKNFGMGPRTFRTKAQDLGDRSVWTDTPADRERKRQEKEKKAAMPSEPPAKKKAQGPTAEELEMHQRVEEYNQKNRPQSLLDMHRSKNDGTKSNEQKPFDRSRDLSMHRKDPKQVDQLIKGAKSMSDKFSTGTYSNKFL